MHAESMLGSSYDLSSCGIGVQREVTRCLAYEPDAIPRKGYLATALHAGDRSNLIFSADLALKEEGPLDRRTSRTLGIEIAVLHDHSRELEDGALVHFAYGEPFRGPVNYRWNARKAKELLETLYREGYFSGAPPHEAKDAVSAFRMWGFNSDFVVVVREAGSVVDSKRIKAEQHALMLGEGRPFYVRFHAEKLDVMASVAERALELRKRLTGEEDYVNAIAENEKRWRQNWSKLFGEEMPPATELIRSARETARSAREAFA